MKIIPNNTNKLIGNLAQGCVVKPEIIIKNEVDYSYSRLLDEEFYWIKTREDKKIARTQGKIPTFPKRYTDLFSYKKNYTTITREDFSQKKQSKFSPQVIILPESSNFSQISKIFAKTRNFE